MLKTRGLNHIDLGTRDMEATRAFYEDVLGFPLVRADLVEIGDDGLLKHFFFDIGNGQLMGFMSGEDVQRLSEGLRRRHQQGARPAPGVYHFAFDAETEQDLLRIREHLQAHGVKVRGPVDHEGWSKSIYFQDPNGLQLEVCHIVRRVRRRRRDAAASASAGTAGGSRTRKDAASARAS